LCAFSDFEKERIIYIITWPLITSRTNQNVGKMIDMVRKDHQLTVWQTMEELTVNREAVRLTMCQNGTKQCKWQVKNVGTRRGILHGHCCENLKSSKGKEICSDVSAR
jgi:hypothetical protein